MRTGPGPVPKTVVDEVQSPTILSPQPMTSRLLQASPATEYPIRSVSPELVPDRMADRVSGGNFARRLTPNPDQQMLRQQNSQVNAVGA
jgi:glucosamine-6-phosphate deaminase